MSNLECQDSDDDQPTEPSASHYNSELVTSSDQPNNNTSLYDKSWLRVSSSALLIMKYKIKHNLTEDALRDLLDLIKLHSPVPNHCISSVYHFKKQFENINYSVMIRHFCYSCLQELVGTSLGVCPNTSCGVALSPDLL